MFENMWCLLDAVTVIDCPREKRHFLLEREEEELHMMHPDRKRPLTFIDGEPSDTDGILEDSPAQHSPDDELTYAREGGNLTSVSSVASMSSISSLSIDTRPRPIPMYASMRHGNRGEGPPEALSTSASSSYSTSGYLEQSRPNSALASPTLGSSGSASLCSYLPQRSSAKMTRRKISPEQTAALQKVFHEGVQFPNREMRERLARQLALSPRTIQVWFQNRRQSLRNKCKDTTEPRQDGEGSKMSIRWMKPVIFNYANCTPHQAGGDQKPYSGAPLTSNPNQSGGEHSLHSHYSGMRG